MNLIKHSINVSNYATILGGILNLDKNKIRNLSSAAKFHDIGKIKIEKSILYKTGKLSFEEKEIIKEHAFLGAEILGSKGLSDEVVHAVRFHHEFWNGTGYEGLKGKEIPLMSRIVSIVDAFDTITSERAYKKAKPINYALGELKDNEEIQFDKNITEVFIDYINTIINKKSYYCFKNGCNIIYT